MDELQKKSLEAIIDYYQAEIFQRRIEHLLTMIAMVLIIVILVVMLRRVYQWKVPQ